ncbi:amidohydrolase [Candidatus Bipolaricaulota bacterium]|nr:amidohydrolase [Candidatus Bipolaricaulota bacterium]TFH09718.1 MAG: amidohydrolase [Candidatus Atribacteria bacterium]
MGTFIRGVRPVEASSSTFDLRFDNRRIASVSDAEPQPGDTEVDARGKLAIAGFVNAHTHLAMVLFRGLADDVALQTWLEDYVWPIEQQLQPEDVYWCTMLAIAEGIRSGTTTFIDMYFHNDQVARAVEESGVRALLGYGMIASSLQKNGTSELAKTEAFIRQWHGQADGRIQVSVSPHAVYTCCEDVIRAGVEMAHKYGTTLHTHVAETRSEVEDWKAQTGTSPVKYLLDLEAFSVPTLAAHCVHVDTDDIAILADHPVIVAHCPKSNAKLGSGIAPVPQMQQAGVHVALGTDGAASNNRLDMLEEMRAAWLLQRAKHENSALLSSQLVVSMAVYPARHLLGLPREGLEKGAPADLVLFDTDRIHTTPSHDPSAMLAYAANSSDVTDVYVDGKALLQNGELRTIDEERVKSEVRRLLHRIKNR